MLMGYFSKKKKILYDMLFTSEFCLCFFFDLGVFLSLSDILRLFCINVSEW